MADADGALPPQILEQLKERGWTWPPTEEMKRQWREAHEQFVDTSPTDPEVRKASLESFPGRLREVAQSP